MNFSPVMRAACLAAALGAGGALAQTAATPVATDVGPPPAEERSSVGAIVLENSLVRAQRDSAGFQRSSARTGVESVGRGVMRETLKQMGGPPLASRRFDPADTFNRGADGEIVPK